MPYLSDGSLFQLGNMTTETAVAITAATPSSGVVTVTATGVDVQDGDVVEITGSTGIPGLNGFHAVTRGGDANTALITDGNLTGTLGTPGTIQRLNTAWTTVAETANINLSTDFNVSDAPYLDDPNDVVQAVMTKATVAATGQLNWLGNAHVSQGMVSGVQKIMRSKQAVWMRVQHDSIDAASPPFECFLGAFTSFTHNIATGSHQTADFGLRMNSHVLHA